MPNEAGWLPPLPVTYTVANDVGLVTLNRPESLNAISLALSEALDDTLAEAAHDEGVRALVLTGAGRAFCAGADLKELSSGAIGQGADPTVETFIDRIRRFPKPTVAAVNGLAVGGGFSIALACDVRICSPEATFQANFVPIGLVPEGGSTWALPRIIGWSNALEVLVSGRRIDAVEARDNGLSNRTVAADELLGAALAWASELGSGDLLAIAAVKQLVQDSASLPYDQHRARERRQFFESVLRRRKAAGPP